MSNNCQIQRQCFFSLSMNSTGNACYQSCPKLNNFVRARNWIHRPRDGSWISWGSGINWEWDQVESLARCRRCRNGIGKNIIGNSQQEKERGILLKENKENLISYCHGLWEETAPVELCFKWCHGIIIFNVLKKNQKASLRNILRRSLELLDCPLFLKMRTVQLLYIKCCTKHSAGRKMTKIVPVNKTSQF